MDRLSGATVLVTGATGNVGWGVAHAAIEAGARVVLPVRSEASGDRVLREVGGRAEVVLYDPGDGASLAALRDGVLASHGRIDHVFASMGGWWQGGASLDQPVQELRDLLDTFVVRQLMLLQAMAPALRARGGSYTLVTGVAGELIIPGAGLLVLAAGSAYALSRVLRAELESDPLRLNELRISCRIEKEARPGVVPSRVAGAAFLDIMRGEDRGQVLGYDGRGPAAPRPT